MCESLPVSKKELLKINGMGKVRVDKYGDAILDVIKSYCEENDIEVDAENIDFEVEKPKKVKVNNSKELSLELFKSGKSIEEIAMERDFVASTIFGHLTSFIDSGEVKVSDLMPLEHYEALKEIIPKTTFEGLSDLKLQLDEKYSYEELRLVIKELNQAK